MANVRCKMSTKRSKITSKTRKTTTKAKQPTNPKRNRDPDHLLLIIYNYVCYICLNIYIFHLFNCLSSNQSHIKVVKHEAAVQQEKKNNVIYQFELLVSICHLNEDNMVFLSHVFHSFCCMILHGKTCLFV